MFKSNFVFGGHGIEPGGPVFTVAEIGVNHFGDVEEGKRLIDLALEAGFDSVKFQFYDVDHLYAYDYTYWKERLKEKQLSIDQLTSLYRYAESQDIFAFCTPHDSKSLMQLEEVFDPIVYKIGSGEYRNFPFIQEICSLGKPVILSTGMYSHSDIQDTLKVIEECGLTELAILHCVSSYPVPEEDVNLNAISRIKEYFPGIVGYSDHSKGNYACLSAVALGAKIVEKHITRRVDVPNAQDWKVSATEEDIFDLIKGIRKIEKHLGTGVKPSPSESGAQEWAKKSIAYREDLKRGRTITVENLIAVRPGNGIGPEFMPQFGGKVLKRDVREFSLLSRDDFE